MIIYLGNMLSKHGLAPTSVEIVGEWLSGLYSVKRASALRNQFLRLLHMCFIVCRHKNRCSLILIDTYSGMAFIYAVVVAQLARLFNIKYVPILRGGELPRRFEQSPMLSESFIRKSAAVVVPSNYLGNELRKKDWSSPVLIPNSIDLSLYEFKPRIRMRPHLLWVRSFQKMYNPIMALKVLKNLKDSGIENVKLCMVGQDKDGTLESFMNLAHELGLEKMIEITGKLTKKDWIKRSREYDIFLNTTNVDNTPVSVIEAMALGLAVVSTNAGGIPFLLEDNVDAIIVEAGDAEAMSNAVIRIINDHSYALTLVHNARRKAEAFSWEVVKTKWITLIEDLQR